MSMCRVFSFVLGRGCLLYDQYVLLAKLISLCSASFRTPRPNLSVTPGVFLLPTFVFQSPMMKKVSFFWVLVLEDLVGLHRTIQLWLLQHLWLGPRLGLLWYWMVCPGNEQRSFCHFWECTQLLQLDSFVDALGYFIMRFQMSQQKLLVLSLNTK